jgi:Family of unknown function (DUF5317)
MLGLLIPFLVTSVVAALRVGSLAGLQRVQIQWWPLALGSVGVQLLLFSPAVDRLPLALAWGPWIWVATLVALLTTLIRNSLSSQTARGALWLGALGVTLNLLVVVANGGYMPQSPEARSAARGLPLASAEATPQLRDVAPSGSETRLPWLGDVLAQPNWLPLANVVSIGDLVLSTAMAIWAFQVISIRRLPQVRRISADSQ